MTRILQIFALTLGTALLLVACSGGGGGSSGNKVTVTGTEFKFTPNQITATVGQPITIEFDNKGTTDHDLKIPDLNQGVDPISPGKSASFTFTPDKAGTYKFECTVPGHADAGMVGTLTVKAS